MVVLVPCSPAGTHLPHVWSSLSGEVTGPKDGSVANKILFEI